MRWSARDPELSVVDAYTRECLALEVDTRSPSLGHGSQLYSRHFPAGPQAICCDNGPNLTSRDFFGVVERQIELVHVQLGKPDMEPNKHITSEVSRMFAFRNAVASKHETVEMRI